MEYLMENPMEYPMEYPIPSVPWDGTAVSGMGGVYRLIKKTRKAEAAFGRA